MTLPRGLLFEILTSAGYRLRGSGKKRVLRCPLHKDRNPSAFASENNVFYCSCCTPEAGWTAKTLCAALGLPWLTGGRPLVPPPRRAEPPARATFSAATARTVWEMSFARAREDERVEEDRPVHDYMAGRGLGEALELGAYGVLPTSGLPSVIQGWPRSGHRIVAPLFSPLGVVVSLQARAILPSKLKVLSPKGARVAETLFADRGGQRVLAGEPAERIVYGEGLTDMLALAICSPWPVLTAPGTSNAVGSVGAWANGADVLLALDCDGAGDEAVTPVAQSLYANGARRVRRVRWPRPINDACQFLAEQGDAALHQWLVRKRSAVVT